MKHASYLCTWSFCHYKKSLPIQFALSIISFRNIIHNTHTSSLNLIFKTKVTHVFECLINVKGKVLRFLPGDDFFELVNSHNEKIFTVKNIKYWYAKLFQFFIFKGQINQYFLKIVCRYRLSSSFYVITGFSNLTLSWIPQASQCF